MNKITAILIMAIMSLVASAQISDISVAGIKMGTPKDKAKSILKERFGLFSLHEEHGNLLVVDGNVGGVTYKFLEFIFIWIDGMPIFNGARFEIPFEIDEQEEAISVRDYIKSIYHQKYDFLGISHGSGECECCYFGNSVAKEAYGYILMEKDKGKDEKERFNVSVIYYGSYSGIDDI